ncbi:hypothetical protein Taro_038921, partial [Colocasia esculenta]|nr:hypothetical protein [Colocasia esculenta]
AIRVVVYWTIPHRPESVFHLHRTCGVIFFPCHEARTEHRDKARARGRREPKRCLKLVNPKASHGPFRSFLDLPGIFGRILTSRGFRPYLDMYKGSCRCLTIQRHGAACRKPGTRERTSFHRKGMGPAPSGRANGMSQASQSFLDFSEWFWVFPSLIDFYGYACHLSACFDFSAICWHFPRIPNGYSYNFLK